MRVVGLLVVLGLIAFGAYALHDASRRPAIIHNEYVPGPDLLKLDPKLQAPVAAALKQRFGTPQEPRFPLSPEDKGFIDPARLAAGRDAYHRRCLHCHGLSGDGDGPTAPFLLPRPRDFRNGWFKFTSTSGDTKKPTRDDLRRTLANGVPGTVMPSFGMEPPEEIEAILDYVLLLSVRGEVEILVAKDEELAADSAGEKCDENVALVVRRWKETEGLLVKPGAPKPPSTAESVRRGEDLFLRHTAKCIECHGADGTGRTPSTIDPRTGDWLKADDWGNPALPADLTQGVYRGGRRPIDLYRRIHSGVKGSPMPGFGGVLKPDQIWDLVHYVQSLAQ